MAKAEDTVRLHHILDAPRKAIEFTRWFTILSS